MSCIHTYYLRGAQSYTELLSRVQHLITARQHLEAYLHSEQTAGHSKPILLSTSPAPDWSLKHSTDVTEKMTPAAVNK